MSEQNIQTVGTINHTVSNKKKIKKTPETARRSQKGEDVLVSSNMNNREKYLNLISTISNGPPNIGHSESNYKFPNQSASTSNHDQNPNL